LWEELSWLIHLRYGLVHSQEYSDLKGLKGLK
jgi:hypothetical protein